MGYVPKLTCVAQGIISTATVLPDPVTALLTVYVNGGDDYLYALNAATGATVWRALVAQNSTTVNGYYNWTSPAVANGKIYVGLSSECDRPFTRGGVKAFNQTTGKLLATHWTMASGQVGGGVWSSVAVSNGGEVYATTGSTNPPPSPQGEAYSILQLDGSTLHRDGIWTVPGSDPGGDCDFGATPSMFTAAIGGVSTSLVAACNKNGRLYAWRAAGVTSGPVWTARINTAKVNPSLAATIFDGEFLYQAGNTTIIGGVSYPGSISKIDPQSGASIWRKGLAASVFGSASLNSAGVLAVSTLDRASSSNGTYFSDATTGILLRFISIRGIKEFSQPVFADKYVLLSPVTYGVSACAP